MQEAQVQPSELSDVLWRDSSLAIDLCKVMSAEPDRRKRPSMVVRANAGPVLFAFLDAMQAQFGHSPFRKLANGIDLVGLNGGLDLSATLKQGSPVFHNGLLGSVAGGYLVIPLAQDLEPDIAHSLLRSMDNVDSDTGYIFIDESRDDETGVNPSLGDRCNFHIDLRPISYQSSLLNTQSPEYIGGVAVCDDIFIEEICALALSFGLSSIRPAKQAIGVAIANARLNGRDRVIQEDISIAIRLCLLNRANAFPEFSDNDEVEQAQQDPCHPEEKADNYDDTNSSSESSTPPDEMEIATEALQLPKGLVSHLMASLAKRQQSKTAGRKGSATFGKLRGRPVSSRKGKPTRGAKIDLISTLRYATPWQYMRRKFLKKESGIVVFPSDFHIKRFKQRTETTTIFVVDASGSTALNRLGEAKGAVEQILSESYASRDHVALISFRKHGAELLLPPTRSLARAKRSLSRLPGGGGTPLADGLRMANEVAVEQERSGRDVSIVILTDGSANIALDGSPGREAAMQDARSVASLLAAPCRKILVLDVGKRSSPRTAELAELMSGHLIAMPFSSSYNLVNALNSGV